MAAFRPKAEGQAFNIGTGRETSVKAAKKSHLSVMEVNQAPSFTESICQRRFIVLDRDGTIIEERGYLSQPEQVKLIPGAGAALREFRQMGFGLVVLTNQSGVGREFFDQAQLERVHERFKQVLDREGVHLDGLYVCPHKPGDDCACRKPKLALLQKAAKDLDFRLKNSIVIGDKDSDIDMGRAAGALTFLVRTGYGNRFAISATADFVVDDLAAAAESLRRLLVAATFP